MSAHFARDQALTYLLQNSPISYGKMMESNFSHGFEKDEKQIALNDLDHTKWSNALETRLPNAPSMNVYCMCAQDQLTSSL